MASLKEFESKVQGTIKEYGLVDKGDKILVACSGGKDSTTALYLLKKFGYNVEAFIIDLIIGNWSKANLENVKKFCKEQGIKLHVISMREEFGCSICYIRSNIQSKRNFTNCMICGVIKRWVMNQKARELGATKVATGHNLDDEVETLMMNIMKGNPGLSITLGPKTGVIRDKKFIPRIKPLYFCTNDEIREYSKGMGFPVLYKPCPCATGAFRIEVRKLVSEMERQDKDVKMNLVKNFMVMLPILRKAYSPKGSLKYCSVCGEPSRNDVCKRCDLMKVLKE